MATIKPVKFDYKKAMAPFEETQKRLIAISLQLEGDIKRSISEKGPSPPGSPPGVDTGRLRASISTNWSDSGTSRMQGADGVGEPGRNENRFTVVVGTNVFYGPLLEYGTRHMPARPFIRPAFDRIKNRIAKYLVSST